MKLVVEVFTGPLFYIEVETNATVADLKREIFLQKDLPYHRLILCLANRRKNFLSNEEDEKPLADFEIKEESHVYVFFKPSLDDGSDRCSSADSPLSLINQDS